MTRNQIATICLENDFTDEGDGLNSESFVGDDWQIWFEQAEPTDPVIVNICPVHWPDGEYGGKMNVTGPTQEFKLRELGIRKFKQIVGLYAAKDDKLHHIDM